MLIGALEEQPLPVRNVPSILTNCKQAWGQLSSSRGLLVGQDGLPTRVRLKTPDRNADSSQGGHLYVRVGVLVGNVENDP